MGEPERQNRSVTPPEGAAVLMGDPLPGLTARDFADRLGEDLSGHDLAEAIALTWSKAGHLMHLAAEDEAFAGEFEEWFDLEKKLCGQAIEILASEGRGVDRGHGTFGAIAPFMERNGYRDACGWWVRVDEYESLPEADGICPACGSRLEGFIEGSCMGQRCPTCGWSVVATYLLPIQLDEREYAITLPPGCAPTKDALKAVSRLMMCNYLGARRMIQDAPTTLFSGRAPEVLEHKRALEGAGVPIAITPDFPYNEDGRLANEVRLNGLLLAEFPELRGKFEEYTSWQDGMGTGCFLTYEDLLLPLARRALDNRDEEFLSRLESFIEGLMTSGDDYAVNVATVGLIEGLKAYGDPLIRSYLGPVSLEEFDALVY